MPGCLSSAVWIMIVGAVMAGCCAPKKGVVSAPSEPACMEVMASGMLGLIGRDPAASAVPISAHYALTCAHVTDRNPQNPLLKPVPLRWGHAATGAAGELRPIEIYLGADLALMYSPTPFPRWYTFASSAPKTGAKIVFRGWDWRDRKRAYAERYFVSEVIRTPAGHVTYWRRGETGASDGGTPGSSGSGVLNEAGELVAVNCGARQMDNPDRVSEAVAVYGQWRPAIPGNPQQAAQ